MKKILVIVVLGLLLTVTAYRVEQIKARYEKIAQEFTKNPNAKIKPMMMKIQGISMKKSLFRKPNITLV